MAASSYIKTAPMTGKSWHPGMSHHTMLKDLRAEQQPALERTGLMAKAKPEPDKARDTQLLNAIS